MKLFFYLFCFSCTLLSCNKFKEKLQEDVVIKAMTDGQWRMTKFTRAGTDITADFAPYLFQFRANNTVEAINNGNTEKTGTVVGRPQCQNNFILLFQRGGNAYAAQWYLADDQ
jgi:hypothetical protein